MNSITLPTGACQAQAATNGAHPDASTNGHIEYSMNGTAASNGYPDAPAVFHRRPFAVCSLKQKADGKADKAPRNPQTLQLAETNDTDTLGTYAEAMAAVQNGRAKACGVVLKRCGVLCIDLDRAFNPETGEVTNGAQFVLAHFAGALVTISASGCGLHIWIKAKPPFSGACENLKYDGQTVEVLAEKFVVEMWRPFGATGEIKPFQNELETLLKAIKPKPTPAPAALPIAANGNHNADAYTRAALLGKLNDARAKMEAAQTGERHDVRLDLAHLLGGFLHYGFFSEADAVSALAVNFGDSESNARKTIADGLENGAKKPLTVTPPEPQPNATTSSTRHDTRDAQTPDPRPAFELFNFQQLGTLPRNEWLVRGLLLENIASVISADSGGFKSFFALDMGLCVALGRPFMGRDTKRGGVVYVAAEGFFTLHERATAWALHHECELPENFHALKVPINLGDAATVAAFAGAIESLSPDLVILDTLSQCAVGADENSNAQMADFVRGMMALCGRIGAHVTVLHHNGKASGTFRGASAIKANVDAHISLERPENDENNTVFVRCEKQRGRPFEPFALRGVEVEIPTTDEYGDAITSLVFEPCGDEVAAQSAKHANAKRADKTRDALLAVFDRCAIEGAPYGGVKIGFWKEAVEESEPKICEERTFWKYRKLLILDPEKPSKNAVIEQCGTHNGSPIFRRIERTANAVDAVPKTDAKNDAIAPETPISSVTATTATTAKCSECSYPNNAASEYCNNCNNTLVVAVVAVPNAVTPKTVVALPGMPEPKASQKENAQAQSEAYYRKAKTVGGVEYSL